MKKTIIKLCKIVPIVLLGCFVVSVITGYARYSSTLNSAPFSVWVLVDTILLYSSGNCFMDNRHCRAKEMEGVKQSWKC